jgi:heavy metal sensor kinase
MIFNSIRWRLQVWHGLILVTVLMGFGFTAYHVARDNQLRRIDQDLEQHLLPMVRPQSPMHPPDHGPGFGLGASPGGPPPGEPRGGGHGNSPDFCLAIKDAIQRASVLDANQTNTFYYVLWNEDGTMLARSPSAPSDVSMPRYRPLVQASDAQVRGMLGEPGHPRPGPMRATLRTRGESRELFRCLPHGECLLVGRSMAPDLAAMHRLALWLVAAGTAVLVVGLAGGWWLASRAIRPIEDISATAVKIAAGDLSQRINASDTESELGRLAGVLNSTFARLEAAFAHQVRFTSDASHELRTPISVILSQTQTSLSRERTAPEYRETLEACQRAAQRMRKLAESLLELARLDAGQQHMKREPFDLARVAGDCVEMVRPLAGERGIDIHCDLPIVECLGDPERVGQIVTNLLSNAIHFNHEKGQVRVSIRAENGAAFLTVADTGTGIPEQDIPHIFERFYRVDKSRSRIQGRTGLGLAICKAIADAHGGSIQVSSQPGEGSAFTVKLPLPGSDL